MALFVYCATAIMMVLAGVALASGWPIAQYFITGSIMCAGGSVLCFIGARNQKAISNTMWGRGDNLKRGDYHEF